MEYRVIGVLPEQPGALEAEREFFAAARWAAPSRKGPFFVQGLGRIKPGLDREAVEAELLAVNRRLFPVWESSFQDRNAVWGQHDLREAIIGEIDKTLYLAFAAVLFVFLIASANAANLLVARSSYRRRELAVRSALGASRSRLLLHLWSENLLLATGASLLAMGVAGGGIRLLQTAGAAFVPRSQEIGLHGPVIWFLLAATVISMILFGFLPSLGLADSNLGQVLHSGSRSVSGARGLQRMRRALVITEVAVAVPLLIGGGLLVGSLVRLQQVDVGFDPAHILTLEVSLPETYDDMASVHQFWNRTLERIRSLSTVSQAGFADGRPPSEITQSNNFDLHDKPTPPGAVQPATPWVAVTPEYFEVLQVPLLQGRLLKDTDNRESPRVVVVDQAWARRFFPGDDAVGRRFQSGVCTTCPPTTIVGVVGTVKYSGMDKIEEGTVYWPMITTVFRHGYILARTQNAPFQSLPEIRRIIRETDPTLPVSRVATAQELIADSLESPRYLTTLVAGFAGTSLLLTLVGIYGVMLFFVQRQTRDIGIRMAVGATPSAVLRLVIKNALSLVLWGTLAGLLLATFLTRFMSSLLFGVGTLDPLTFSLATGLILLTALGATVLPAWRATRVDPVRVLRQAQ